MVWLYLRSIPFIKFLPHQLTHFIVIFYLNLLLDGVPLLLIWNDNIKVTFTYPSSVQLYTISYLYIIFDLRWTHLLRTFSEFCLFIPSYVSQYSHMVHLPIIISYSLRLYKHFYLYLWHSPHLFSSFNTVFVLNLYLVRIPIESGYRRIIISNGEKFSVPFSVKEHQRPRRVL